MANIWEKIYSISAGMWIQVLVVLLQLYVQSLFQILSHNFIYFLIRMSKRSSLKNVHTYVAFSKLFRQFHTYTELIWLFIFNCQRFFRFFLNFTRTSFELYINVFQEVLCITFAVQSTIFNDLPNKFIELHWSMKFLDFHEQQYS